MRGKLWIAAFSIPLLAAVNGAFADVSATGTIQLTSTGGTQASPVYNYSIAVTNNGSSSIDAFWYGWVDSPAYDFLVSSPTVTGTPTGWIAPIEGSGPPYDGYSIEWYNINGSALAPGGTDHFSFSTPDSPSVLSGLENTYYNLYVSSAIPIQTSFVYSGTVQNSADFSFVLPNPTVAAAPEPASLAVLGLGAVALISRRRRARA